MIIGCELLGKGIYNAKLWELEMFVACFSFLILQIWPLRIMSVYVYVCLHVLCHFTTEQIN
jgi:hypothetical protein